MKRAITTLIALLLTTNCSDNTITKPQRYSHGLQCGDAWYEQFINRTKKEKEYILKETRHIQTLDLDLDNKEDTIIQESMSVVRPCAMNHHWWLKNNSLMINYANGSQWRYDWQGDLILGYKLYASPPVFHIETINMNGVKNIKNINYNLDGIITKK